MFRRKVLGAVLSTFVLAFCIACLSGNRLGTSQALANQSPEPQPDPGDGVVDQDPEPVDSNGPCPPESYTVHNPSDTQKDMIYECSGNAATISHIDPHKTVVFDGGGIGGCSGCDQGDDNCICIQCALTQLVVDGVTLVDCDMANAYFNAYGLDLAAESVKGDVPLILPEPIYVEIGGKLRRKQQWAIPVLNENRELVGWEFTTTQPRFSVEDGEVVIRSKIGKVIGGPEGLTVDKD